MGGIRHSGGHTVMAQLKKKKAITVINVPEVMDSTIKALIGTAITFGL